MSDLSATNCGGGCSPTRTILPSAGLLSFLLLCCGGCGNGFGGGMGGDCGCIIWILIILCFAEAITDSVDSAAGR